MSLSDFFQPFTSINLILLFIIFVGLDVLGSAILSKLDPPPFLRPCHWLVGLAIFVFIWFILHFWVPFLPVFVWMTMGGCYLASPYYIKHQLWPNWRDLRWVITILAISIGLVGKRLLYWLVLPPYGWDEMAYHFYSPYRLFHETSWHFFPGGLLSSGPKLMETGYVLSLALSHGYFGARFLHLAIFLSVGLSIFLFLKKEISVMAGLIFYSGYLFLNANILVDATTGYIDSASGSLRLLLLIIAIHTFLKPSKKSYLLLTMITGLVLSVKYTTLSYVAALVIIFIAAALIKYKFRILEILRNHWRYLFVVSFTFFIFGGFWFAKNLIIFHNPVYPFEVICWPKKCQLNSFFSEWTLPISWQSLPAIRDQLVDNNPIIYTCIILSCLLALIGAIFGRNKRLLMTIYFISASLGLEVLLCFKLSGFVPRFFYHWYLVIPLLLSLPWLIPKQVSKLFRFFYLTIGLILLSLLIQGPLIKVRHEITNFNQPNDLTNKGYLYLTKQLTFKAWLDSRFPQMSEVVKWCSRTETPVTLLVSDPMLIWRSYEGLIRVYLEKCQWEELGVMSEVEYGQTLQRLDQSSIKLISLVGCEDQLKNPFTFNTPEFQEYDQNQKLVCQMKETAQHVYEKK